MDLCLRGRVSIVSGPAKGMGPAIVSAFGEEGCRLVLAGRDMTAIDGVAETLHGSGVEVITVRCDVTKSGDCEALVDKAVAHFGRLDILVNVAGGSGPMGKTTWTTSSEEFKDIVDVNMAGCFNTMRAVLPRMVAQQYGKIVNVGGTFGMRGRAGRMAYSASKWGLRGITKSAALEAGPYNININSVAPGMVDGERFRGKVIPEMMRKLGISEDEAIERHASEYAMRRISSGRDVANACLFLASDVSRQMTGVDLPVDGGWAML
ncbi:SDR family NAD(P)-dependent oxidoreductase [Telmatospirillum siberiense]|uniref:Short-chain dehydrogenase n=1 Tax=Telmatospirillum siberiense TaxID=382514 RepID=A0A2N3PPT6_9PROT|nr:SDR family NAD(P)-dependent oxidoreductase [Telmatospirillum siberiense]PKU22404.1 short-chain dehydrogenase [Telmatospirillum siberiense]